MPHKKTLANKVKSGTVSLKPHKPTPQELSHRKYLINKFSSFDYEKLFTYHTKNPECDDFYEYISIVLEPQKKTDFLNYLNNISPL